MTASFRLSDQVAVVLLLVLLFSCLSSHGPLSPATATVVVAGLSLLLFLAFLLVSSRDEGESAALSRRRASVALLPFATAGWRFARSALVCLLGGFIVSPILKTLTETISTDTVYAMVTVMMMLHVIFFDYGIESAIVSPPVSLNAGLFGAVCLASRLSTLHSFTLLVFAADIFVLLTILRQRVEKRMSKRWRTTFSILVVVVSVAAIATKATVFFVAYLVMLFLFNGVFPLFFYQLQSLKE